jgi:nitroimidazol reductase NimA-like FMN-containing flavoprotein (pyridoxamine 5'-phosphate oxidase superfamily)
MRRKDQEITDRSEIDDIIEHAQVARLGMVDGDRPYVVPMCFGYDGANLYVHCALDGMKVDILKKNPNVCFEIETGVALEAGKAACDWGMTYRSVIGFGKAVFLENIEEKRKALEILMKQYTDQPFPLPDKAVEKTAVIRIDIESMTGKRSN